MDFRFREGDLRSHNSSPSPASDAGFFATQAFLARQREIEKERIREEILAEEELAHRRELEHEVRRELALERNMVAFHERLKFPSVSEPRVPMPTLRLPPIQEARVFERVPLPPLDVKPAPFTLEARMEDRLAFASLEARVPLQRDSGSFHRQRFLDTTDQPKKLLGNPSKPPLAGKKRKVAPAVFQELPGLATTEKSPPSEWKCDLCQVSCTSKNVWMDHLVGKKHAAKEERAKTEKGGASARKSKESSTVPAKKSRTEPKEKKNSDVGFKQQKGGKMGHNAKRLSFEYWCEHCKIGSASECVFQAHLTGKKHLVWMARQMMNKDGSAAAAGNATVKENSKAKDADTAEKVGKVMKVDGVAAAGNAIVKENSKAKDADTAEEVGKAMEDGVKVEASAAAVAAAKTEATDS